jgi:hypothetical protein
VWPLKYKEVPACSVRRSHKRVIAAQLASVARRFGFVIGYAENLGKSTRLRPQHEIQRTRSRTTGTEQVKYERFFVFSYPSLILIDFVKINLLMTIDSQMVSPLFCDPNPRESQLLRYKNPHLARITNKLKTTTST